MGRALELHYHLSDDFQATLERDYTLDDTDVARINAVCVAWGEEEAGGQSLAEMRRDLEGRVLKVVTAPAPVGTPTSPGPCPTCGAAPGEPCVYTGTEAVRYMLHRARKEAVR